MRYAGRFVWIWGSGALSALAQEKKPTERLPSGSERGGRQAGAARLATAKAGDVWVNPKDGAEMVYISAGPFAWGDTFDLMKVGAGKSATTGVGHYGLTPEGLSDLGGNVRQWCRDWYDATFWSRPIVKESDASDLFNSDIGAQKYRALRGGPWSFSDPGDFRAAYRYFNDPEDRDDASGFRCVSGRMR